MPRYCIHPPSRLPLLPCLVAIGRPSCSKDCGPDHIVEAMDLQDAIRERDLRNKNANKNKEKEE